MSYNEFPPYAYFMQVLRHQPDCALFYAKIWSSRNNENKLVLDKKNIYGSYLVTPNVFKRKLFYLMEEGFANIEESPYQYHIEFLDFDEDTPEPKKKEKLHETKLTPFG